MTSTADPTANTPPVVQHTETRPLRDNRARSTFITLTLLTAVLVALTYTRLPPGICFHDSGDLQTAAAALGIAHPPGYAGYASLGYCLTLIPGLDPARAVTLGCLAAGIGALLFCAGIQIRLGVHPWLAAAIVLGLALHPRVWINLIIPEVYAPTWFFVMAAAYLLVVYLTSDSPASRYLYPAFFLLGVAAANRPPVLLMLPGFAIGLLLLWLHKRIAAKRILKMIGICIVGFLLPAFYSLGYFWVRDTDQQFYNYIEQDPQLNDMLPSPLDGPEAKIRRIWWLVSGAQYAAERVTGGTFLGRLSWIAEQIGAELDPVFLAIIVAFAVGAVVVRRRNLHILILLLGILLGGGCFLCLYRAYDTAADMLPLLGVLGVFAGTALSSLLPQRAGRGRAWAAFALFALTAVGSAQLVTRYPNHAAEYDATGYARSIDWSVVPDNALILTDWRKNAPLQYSRLIGNSRSDASVLHVLPEYRTAYAAREAAAGRAVFSANPPPAIPGLSITPAGALWRWEFHDSIPNRE